MQPKHSAFWCNHRSPPKMTCQDTFDICTDVPCKQLKSWNLVLLHISGYFGYFAVKFWMIIFIHLPFIIHIPFTMPPPIRLISMNPSVLTTCQLPFFRATWGFVSYSLRAFQHIHTGALKQWPMSSGVVSFIEILWEWRSFVEWEKKRLGLRYNPSEIVEKSEFSEIFGLKFNIHGIHLATSLGWKFWRSSCAWSMCWVICGVPVSGDM